MFFFGGGKRNSISQSIHFIPRLKVGVITIIITIMFHRYLFKLQTFPHQDPGSDITAVGAEGGGKAPATDRGAMPPGRGIGCMREDIILATPGSGW